MKKLLKSIVKTAAFAAAFLPYRVEKDGDDCKVTALLYSLERHTDRSDEENVKDEYTLSVLPSVQEQFDLACKLVSDCRAKWNDPEDEQVKLIKDKLNLAKEKIGKIKNGFSGEDLSFDDEEFFDEGDFSEEEFTAGFAEEKPEGETVTE